MNRLIKASSKSRAAPLVLLLILLMPSLSWSKTSQSVSYFQSALWTGVADVKVVGNTAYTAFWNGFGVLEVSNPAAPVLTGRLYLEGGRGWAVDLQGNYAYVADREAGLKIVDITDPKSPAPVSNLPGLKFSTSVAIKNKRAYVTDKYFGLHVYDITDPSLPVLVLQIPLNGINREGVLDGNILYVTNSEHLLLFDVTDPSAVSLAGDYKTSGIPLGIEVVNRGIILADFASLMILRRL
ncbi:MAG: LVIVD repeat-containing protein [Thermodesulfobacteriota bacterium]